MTDLEFHKKEVSDVESRPRGGEYIEDQINQLDADIQTIASAILFVLQTLETAKESTE